MWRASGDHRPDFDLIFVVEHFVFGDEFIAADDEVRLDDEVQLLEQLFGLLGAFDFDASRGVTELNLHEAIICRGCVREQGAKCET